MGYKVYGNDIQEINNVKTLLNHRVKQYDAIIKDINSATTALKTKCDGEYVTALIIKLDQIKTALKQQKENSLHLIKLSTKFVKIFHNDCHSLDLDEDLLLQNQSTISQRINALDTVKVSLLTDHALQLHHQYMRNISSLKNIINKELKLLHNAVVNSNQITVNDIYNTVKDIRKFAAQSIKVATTVKKIKTYCENVKQLDNSIDILGVKDPNKLVGKGAFDKKVQHYYDKLEGFCLDKNPKFNFSKKSKWHYAGKRFKNSIKSQVKSDWTPKGFTESWKNASKVGKVAKGLGVAGTVITIFDDYNDNIGSKIANGETPGVVDVVNTATDIGVDLGAGYAAAAAGAAIGGPFGLAAGFLIGVGVNAKCIGGKSLVDLAKTSVKCVNNWLFNGS